MNRFLSGTHQYPEAGFSVPMKTPLRRVVSHARWVNTDTPSTHRIADVIHDRPPGGVSPARSRTGLAIFTIRTGGRTLLAPNPPMMEP